jgi:hypothetical protein
MLGEIINSDTYIEVKYNDLVNMEGVTYSKRAIPKRQINYIALEKNNNYVEVCLTNGEIFQVGYSMFQNPLTESNQELFEILKNYL